ncbi:MAG TPA: peptidoglycan-binding domain-containing protein [Candidatus Polarisedimenticolia bacterium]|nr:peptidoglycan-binding domain-containing protein [Candidatus Polarisedimenticolia bacterium]
MATRRLGSVPCTTLLGLLLVLLSGALPAFADGMNRTGPIYSSSESIAAAQTILEQAHYLAPGSYKRGDMDRATLGAILAFQRRHDVRPTGLIDSETMGLLTSHGRGQIQVAAQRTTVPPSAAEERGALTSRVAARTMPTTGSPYATRLALGALILLAGLGVLFRRRTA